jgi:beta-phosphoglucomutase-like phosphatase (HAD superfamily)
MRLVFLQLRSLMGGNRVLQRQRVQPQFVAEARDRLAVRRFQLDPEKAIGLADVFADIVEGERAGFGVVDEQAVDGSPARSVKAGILAAGMTGRCVSRLPG